MIRRLTNEEANLFMAAHPEITESEIRQGTIESGDIYGIAVPSSGFHYEDSFDRRVYLLYYGISGELGIWDLGYTGNEADKAWWNTTPIGILSNVVGEGFSVGLDFIKIALVILVGATIWQITMKSKKTLGV